MKTSYMNHTRKQREIFLIIKAQESNWFVVQEILELTKGRILKGKDKNLLRMLHRFCKYLLELGILECDPDSGRYFKRYRFCETSMNHPYITQLTITDEDRRKNYVERFKVSSSYSAAYHERLKKRRQEREIRRDKRKKERREKIIQRRRESEIKEKQIMDQIRQERVKIDANKYKVGLFRQRLRIIDSDQHTEFKKQILTRSYKWQPPPPEALKSGIYFLVKNEYVVYIGKAKCIAQRILFHYIDKTKDFDDVHWISVPENELNSAESICIKFFTPAYNGGYSHTISDEENFFDLMHRLFGAVKDQVA